jgi:hypothetical protein
MFFKGEPTAMVRDGGVGSYDEPPPREVPVSTPQTAPAAAQGSTQSPPASPVLVQSSAVPQSAPLVTQVAVTWTTLAVMGSLILAQSPHEFIVYDGQSTYGRWPVTQEGYHYAKQTFDSHSQSLAHGIAYTATGYRDPVAMGLPTEPVIKSTTYASPLSYIGSTRRLIAWATKASKRSPVNAALAWVLAIFGMLFMWTFLLFWYFVVFFLFGIFMFPYRLIRRGQRKSLHVQQTALATQQAMLQQQQAMMQQVQQQPVTYAPSPHTGSPYQLPHQSMPPLPPG